MQQIFYYYLRLILGFGGPLLSGGAGPCPICPVGNQSLGTIARCFVLYRCVIDIKNFEQQRDLLNDMR